MPALLDGRPPGLDAFFRPGKTFTFDMPWTAGALTGRTFEATLDAATLAVAIDGDTMTVTATAAQTTTAGLGAHEFTLTETTGGISEPVIVGTWVGSARAATSSTSGTVTVTGSAATVAVTVAGTDARYHRPHITVADGWGTRWRQARTEANERAVQVAVIADSIGVGGGATDWRTGGFVGRLRSTLQARYGSAGDGFVAATDCRNNENFLIPGFPVPTVGDWTVDKTKGGPNGAFVRPDVAGTGQLTFTVDSNGQLTIWSYTDPTYGRYDYKIDGGATVQVPQNLEAGIQGTVVNVTPGVHTVDVFAAAGLCGIFGVQGNLRASGVAVQNLSLFGRQLSYLPGTNTVGTSPAVSALRTTTNLFSGANTPADVGILCLGINDVDSDVTEDSVVNNVDAHLRLLRGWKLHPVPPFGDRLVEADDPADLIVVIEHRARRKYELVGVEADANVRWTRICSALRSTAATYGAAIVDMWGYGSRSYERWNAAGYLFDDSGHPSDLGAAAYASQLLDVLTAI